MSAYSVSEPFLQFVDRDGQPLEDGYVFIGLGGANPEANPITVYLDAALTTPIAQPIRTTNGYPVNGSTPIALYVNASDYSVTLKDKNGSLVVTRLSNVLSVPFDNTTGNISATRVTFTQTGSSVSRTVDSKLKESVSVFDFMTPAQIADVQARTLLLDVTAPIRAAFLSGARDIYFPAGSYRVTSAPLTPVIEPTPGVATRIHGAGNGISSGPFAASTIVDYGTGYTVYAAPTFIQSTITMSDMAFLATAGTSTQLRLDNCYASTFERLWFSAAGFDSIKVENSTAVTFRNVTCTGTAAGGGFILGKGTSSCVIDSCNATGFANAVWITDDGGTRPSAHTVIGSTIVSVTGASLYLDNADDCRVYGCTFPGGDPNQHILIDGDVSPALRNVIHGCTLQTVGGASTMDAIVVNRAEDTVIDSCSLAGGPAAGGNSYSIFATAIRTRLIANTLVSGSPFNLSDSTSVISFEAGVVPGVRVAIGTSTTSTKFESSSGVPRVRFGDQRLWANDTTGNVYTWNTTPTAATDGYVVGPGVEQVTWAGRPTSPIIGMVVHFTDLLAAPAGWNAAILGPGGGINKYFGRWDGLVWRAT